MEFLIILLLIFGMIIYSSLSWGLVLFKFWAWFVLPVFTTLPDLGFWPAVGLMFVIGLFHGTAQVPKETNSNMTAAVLFLGPWMALIMGWIIGSLWIF